MFKVCALGVLFAVSACKARKDEATGALPVEEKGLGGETIATLTQLQKKMCACADPTCAQSVLGELTAFNTRTVVKLNKSESAVVAKVSADLAACMQKANAPSTEPEKK
ncbi:hypothetical protein BH11MYX1_BH11MYX1_35340 [soil metagenome]